MLLSLGQSSAPNAARTEQELSFLHAVEFSDVATCGKLLEENPTLNVDVIDALGRTALRLAVRNENGEVVEMLLERCNNDNIMQAALQAISENHTTIAEIILQHPSYLRICKKRQRLGDTDGFYQTEAESQFSTDITPLNLAAQKNNYAIVHLLLQRGETISKPHRFDCVCVECNNRMEYDQLRTAYFRLNAYRGLASEAYITLSSDDPFLTAFQLAKRLRQLSMVEVHFNKEYRDLSNQLSSYVVKLLDRVWSQQELEVVLNKKGAQADVDKYENLARLKLAMRNKEKRFVAHPSVQQYLVKIWYYNLYPFDTYTDVKRVLCFLLLSAVYPLIVISHLFNPDWKVSRLAKQPKMKFLGHTTSLFVFLLLVIVSSTEFKDRVSSRISLASQYPTALHEQYILFRNHLGDKAVPFGEDFPLRPHSPTLPECLISIWVVGMVVLEIQKITVTGVVVHFKDLYNLVDFFLLQTYIAALILFALTLLKTMFAIDHLKGQNVTSLLQDPKESFVCYYWLNTDRMNWQQADPMFLAEGMFALANIISFARIFYLLPSIETLGPLQISLRRMINDIIKFLVFAGIGLIGFIVSLRNVFWWYSGQLASEMSEENVQKFQINDTNAAVSFLDLRLQFTTVFWWIYGRGPMDKALDVPSKYENSQVTEVAGKFLSALYHIEIIILLVNLLIAMMSRSFEKTVIDVDIEWKYARSLLYMEYMNEKCAFPVPINILQPIRDVVVMLVSCLRCLGRRRRKDGSATDPSASPASGSRRDSTCTFDSPLSGHPTPKSSRGMPSPRRNLPTSLDETPATYKDIVQMIVQRYLLDVQRDEEINKSKLEHAKFNLSQTKQELLHFMKERDRKISHTSVCLKALTSEISTLTPPLPTPPVPIGGKAEDRLRTPWKKKQKKSSSGRLCAEKPRPALMEETSSASQPEQTSAEREETTESVLTKVQAPLAELICFESEARRLAATATESEDISTRPTLEQAESGEAGVIYTVPESEESSLLKSKEPKPDMTDVIKDSESRKVSIEGEKPAETEHDVIIDSESRKVSIEGEKRAETVHDVIIDSESRKVSIEGEKPTETARDVKGPDSEKISVEERKAASEVHSVEVPESEKFPVKTDKSQTETSQFKAPETEKVATGVEKLKPEGTLRFDIPASEKISVRPEKPQSERIRAKSAGSADAKKPVPEKTRAEVRDAGTSLKREKSKSEVIEVKRKDPL